MYHLLSRKDSKRITALELLGFWRSPQSFMMSGKSAGGEPFASSDSGSGIPPLRTCGQSGGKKT